MNEKELEALANRIMSVPGIDRKHESFIELEEVDDNQVFFKFMSDGGKTDNFNGATLNLLLWNNIGETKYEFFDDRKFYLDIELLKSFLEEMGV